MVARKVSTAGGAGFGAVGPATGAVGGDDNCCQTILLPLALIVYL